MDVDVEDPVLNIQMSDVFNSDTEEDKNIQFEEENFEDDEHTVIYIEEVQEGEATEIECDDLFEETQDLEGLENAEQYYVTTEDLDEDIKETGSEQYENFCDRLSINENNGADDVDDNKYECIIIDPDDIKKNDESKKTEESTASIVDESSVVSPAEKNSCDDDCVLISDDEEVPVKKPIEIVRKRIERVIVKATEETILKEFYFEEEDISIVDEQKIEGPKKTLVRRTAEGYRCPLYCTFTASDRPLMIAHLIKHKKSVVSNESDNEAAYECPMCVFKTFTHSAFVYHITKHKKRGYGLVCSKCPFTAKNLTTLKQHITSIHALYIYCQNCPYKAKKLIALRKHEGRCKKAKKKLMYNLPCHFDPCPFTAATEEHLKTHEWIQHQVGSTKIRSYKCPQDGCYFDTIRKELFDEHVSMHTGEEMQCKLCNYKTGDFNSFKEHILTHISVP